MRYWTLVLMVLLGTILIITKTVSLSAGWFIIIGQGLIVLFLFLQTKKKYKRKKDKRKQ